MTTPLPIACSPPGRRRRPEPLEIARRDLPGPVGGPHEEITQRRLLDRCLLGALAPRGTTRVAGEDGLLGHATEVSLEACRRALERINDCIPRAPSALAPMGLEDEPLRASTRRR